MATSEEIEVLRNEFNQRLDELEIHQEDTPFDQWIRKDHPEPYKLCHHGVTYRKQGWNAALKWADEELHQFGFTETSKNDIRPMIKRGKEN